MSNEALFAFIPVIISIGMLIGGFLAFKNGYKRQMGEIENNVINALKTLNEAQERQINSLENEVARMKQVLKTIQIALERRGLTIEIDRDSITLIDAQARAERTVQISMSGPLSALPKEDDKK